jgi:hypothetical protein
MVGTDVHVLWQLFSRVLASAAVWGRNTEQKEDIMVNLDKYYKEMTPSSMTIWVEKPEEAKDLIKEIRKEWGHIFWEIVSRENSEDEKETTLYILKIAEQSRGAVGS